MDHGKSRWSSFVALAVAVATVAAFTPGSSTAVGTDLIDPDAIEIDVGFAQVNDVSKAGNDGWAARGSVNLAPPSSAGPAFTPVDDAVANGATVSIYQVGSGGSGFAAFAGGAVGSYSLIDSFDFAPENCRSRSQGRSLACSDGASYLRLRWRRNSANDYRLVVKVSLIQFDAAIIPGNSGGPRLPLAVQVTIPGQAVWEGYPAVENCVVSHNGDRTTCRSTP